MTVGTTSASNFSRGIRSSIRTTPFRAGHWFGVRNNLALEYIYTTRGMVGRIGGQAVEKKHAGRIFWDLPLSADVDAQLGFGVEKIANLNLVGGSERTNQLVKIELKYRY